ncbi:MAG: division/cell wall cluster transcriptional repressor MraZ [Candidatus Omnitrophota bacterium]|jgi:MraZ protein|nr:division/cell wall cluster transcriptional repressor MraZ [Candidatus Omnitrophota bacterium]MDD5736749.1 division/cell wall cluster transcriptional repressor MraZ [Candidatus Omnitrophota bacterium]
MFYGEYEHTIDRKGRIIIPSKFREVFKENFVEKFYVTRGLDKCLFVFTEEEWKLAEQKFKGMSFTKADSRKFNRLFFSGAVDVTCDKQGRVLLPQYLKDYAGIKRDVMIVGVSNRMEIWSKEEWNRYYDNAAPSFEKTAENLLELDNT